MSQQNIVLSDEVLIVSRSYVRGPFKIERETKTLWIVNGDQFRKDDLRQRGDFGAWTPRPTLVPVNSEQGQRELRRALVSRARARFIIASETLQSAREPDVLEAAQAASGALNNYIAELKIGQL